MQDRLEKAIKAIEKIKKECGTHEQHDGCPYFFKKECSAISTLPFLKEFAERNPEEKSIVLKNIDTSMRFFNLRNKLIEDREKFENAVTDCILSNYCVEDAEEYDKHAIESLWDMIQTGLEMINKAGISADEVMEGYQKYLEKIKK